MGKYNLRSDKGEGWLDVIAIIAVIVIVAVLGYVVWGFLNSKSTPTAVANIQPTPKPTATLVPTPTQVGGAFNLPTPKDDPIQVCNAFLKQDPTVVAPKDIKPQLKVGEKVIFKEEKVKEIGETIKSPCSSSKYVLSRSDGSPLVFSSQDVILQQPCETDSRCRRVNLLFATDKKGLTFYVASPGSTGDPRSEVDKIVLDTTVAPLASNEELQIIDLRLKNLQVKSYKGKITTPVGGPSFKGGAPLITVEGEPLNFVVASFFMPPEGTSVEVLSYTDPRAWDQNKIMAVIETTPEGKRLWYFDSRFSGINYTIWKW